jgi:hypothetical protein
MPFNLYITLGGLCVLTDTGSDLLVLLPDTRGHGEPHVPVLGWDRRFQPDAPKPTCEKGLMEHMVNPGEITLHGLPSGPIKKPEFAKFDIVNLQTATRQPPNPANALIWMRISDGELATEVEKSDPARWFWPPAKDNLLMATFATWKVTGLTNKVGNEEGIQVSVNGVTITLRPQPDDDGERLIGMYLFHVLRDERPCLRKPTNIQMKPGQKAPHFSAFYDLFDAPADNHSPEYCNDGSSRICDEAKGVLGGRAFISIGLRYTCIMGGAQG